VVNEVKGVIARGKGMAVEVGSVMVPDPGPGEVLVKIKACGVCHTDLHYREGAISDEFPFFLGHEASGVVEAIGANVDNVAPGDFVISAWRSPCGTCRSCLRGRPWYCFDSRNAVQNMTLKDGTVLSPALGIGAFAELTLVDAGQAVKVNSEADPKVAGLLGCGVMAGTVRAKLAASIPMPWRLINYPTLAGRPLRTHPAIDGSSQSASLSLFITSSSLLTTAAK